SSIPSSRDAGPAVRPPTRRARARRGRGPPPRRPRGPGAHPHRPPRPPARAEPIPLARPVLGEAEERAVVEVLRSGQLSLGPRVPAFEDAFARRLGGGPVQ